MKRVALADEESLYDLAVRQFETVAKEAIRRRGRFRVVLPGGSTPLPLYERLVDSDAISWAAVDVFWSDERCAPPEDSRSNYGAAKAALLDRVPIPAENVHRVRGEDTPIEAADAYEALLRRALVAEGRLDLVLLGLGVDGHTASLFPRHQALFETERWVLAVHTSAMPPWRITMTLPLINAARDVLVLVAGEEKAEILARVERGEDVPASRVCPARGRLTWITAVDSTA
jgi:6-phosphogluconolactonase